MDSKEKGTELGLSEPKERVTNLKNSIIEVENFVRNVREGEQRTRKKTGGSPREMSGGLSNRLWEQRADAVRLSRELTF